MKAVFEYSGGSCHLSGQPVFSSLEFLSKDLLAEAGKAGSMVVDLKGVSDCDSAFVALLTACLSIKNGQKQTLELNNCPKKLLDMLEVYGLSDCGMRINGTVDAGPSNS